MHVSYANRATEDVTSFSEKLLKTSEERRSESRAWKQECQVFWHFYSIISRDCYNCSTICTLSWWLMAFKLSQMVVGSEKLFEEENIRWRRQNYVKQRKNLNLNRMKEIDVVSRINQENLKSSNCTNEMIQLTRMRSNFRISNLHTVSHVSSSITWMCELCDFIFSDYSN